MYTQKIAVILDDSRLGLETKFVLNKITQSPLLFYKVNWTAPKYSHFTSQVRLRFVETFGLKNKMARGIGKCLTLVICQIASKTFGKLILKPL